MEILFYSPTCLHCSRQDNVNYLGLNSALPLESLGKLLIFPSFSAFYKVIEGLQDIRMRST